MAEKATRTVFIGNIPYGQSEEQIKDICSTVGQVLSFRPIYDSDTGRPKGFGFVEYADSDAASSAVRNLNGYKIEGRELRVDFSKRSDAEPSADAGASVPQPTNTAVGSGAGGAGGPAGAGTNGIGPLPPGVEVPAGLTCQDAISKTLHTLPPQQLLDILSQMKNLVTGDPGKATELLRQAPQLSYAIFQALLLMGLVDSTTMASVVQQAAAGGQPVIPERPAPVPQQTPYAPTPPMGQQGPYGGPPPQQQTPMQAGPPPPPPPGQQVQPSQAELLKQVMDMPQAVVDQLPPAERAQIMQLKQQYGGRIGF